ncbi:MAG: Nif3-like dinuclear metal center hexameric protein [Deltaproteobacteria bacterium]|nr:Nif3-like dinuclear metal center hexameric protein [Deltaproteobacteria bacterium]
MILPPITLQTIINILNDIAPFAWAEDWDNVGLMLGDPDQEISGILTGLDPATALLAEARDIGANLIITHHPAIFHPLKNIQAGEPDAAFIVQAIKDNIAVVACHTNLDIVAGGVNTALAAKLGLVGVTALVPATLPPPAIGLGLIGRLPKALGAESFFTNICQKLDLPAVNISGPIPASIERVAVCGGSGSEFAPVAQKAGVQVYITGEVKHNTARWAEEAGFCVVDAGHFGTENVVIAELTKILGQKLAGREIDIPLAASTRQQNPFTLFYPLSR